MSEFKISFDNIWPADKAEFMHHIENDWPEDSLADFFTKSLWIFKGTLTFSKNGHFIRIKSDRIFYFLDRIIKDAFWLSFRRPIGFVERASIPKAPNNKSGDGSHSLYTTLLENGVKVEVFFSQDAKHESDVPLTWKEGISFSTSLHEYNRAVWNVYDDMLVIVEEMLDGIDGFEDRFCYIPFRGENHIGDEWPQFTR